MDPATIVMLAKIVSDLIIVVTLGIKSVEGMTEEQKQETLASLQSQTTQLVAELQAMAAK